MLFKELIVFLTVCVYFKINGETRVLQDKIPLSQVNDNAFKCKQYLDSGLFKKRDVSDDDAVIMVNFVMGCKMVLDNKISSTNPCESACIVPNGETDPKGLNACIDGCKFAQVALMRENQQIKPAAKGPAPLPPVNDAKPISVIDTMAKPVEPIIEIAPLPKQEEPQPGIEFKPMVKPAVEPALPQQQQQPPAVNSVGSGAAEPAIALIDPLNPETIDDDSDENNSSDEDGSSEENKEESIEESNEDVATAVEEGEAKTDNNENANQGGLFELLNSILLRSKPVLIDGQSVDVQQPEQSQSQSSHDDNANMVLPDLNFINQISQLANRVFATVDSIVKSTDNANVNDDGKIQDVYIELLPGGGVKVQTSDNNDDNNNNVQLLNSNGEPQKPFFNFKGAPLNLNSQFQQFIDGDNSINNDDSGDNDEQMPNYYKSYRRYRVCMPIQLKFSTLCRDINNIFNCTSIYTGLPRWILLLALLVFSFIMLWFGIYLLAMVQRMRKRQRLQQLAQSEDYLPLYKDIDFSIETRIEAAGPLPEKQPLPTTQAV